MYSRVPRERPRQYSNGLRTESQKIFLKDLNYTFVALKTLGSVAEKHIFVCAYVLSK